MAISQQKQYQSTFYIHHSIPYIITMRIYTVGYGNLTFEEIVALLKKHTIDVLIDVRRSPYSRNRKYYRKAELEKRLPTHNIKYIFMGDSLGGLINDDEYYDSSGQPLWDKMRTRQEFLRGIETLIETVQKRGKVTLFCAEADPLRCHRTHLIGAELHNRDIEVIHLLHNGAAIDHADLKIKPPPQQTDLFG